MKTLLTKIADYAKIAVTAAILLEAISLGIKAFSEKMAEAAPKTD